MRKFNVQCGRLSKSVSHETAGQAAQEAMRFWIDCHETRFSTLMKVLEDGQEGLFFSTGRIMKDIGFECDAEAADNEIYKPRLCESTVTPSSIMACQVS